MKLPDVKKVKPVKIADDAKERLSGASRKLVEAIGSSASSAKGVLDAEFKKTRASKVERRHEYSVMWISFIIIVISSAIFFLIGGVVNDADWGWQDFFFNMGCNILALFVVVLCLDTLVNRNKDSRIQRDEARKILRYNRLIGPEIDMYLVRKNMVITPVGKPVHKFRVDSTFTVQDMKDMYGPSELVSDVGISKIRRYAHYQSVLRDYFEKLIENVDFIFYPEVGDAALRYLNAASYGEAAIEAVLSYEDSRAGTKSMKSMIIAMMRDEPADGCFMNANATMKNIYLVHQMINDQEKAVSEYLRMIKILQEQDPSESSKRNVEYE